MAYRRDWQHVIDDAQMDNAVFYAGRLYTRIPYTHEPWMLEAQGEETEPCGDCNCAPGQLHVPTCDIEQCPVCQHQRISCPHWWELKATHDPFAEPSETLCSTASNDPEDVETSPYITADEETFFALVEALHEALDAFNTTHPDLTIGDCIHAARCLAQELENEYYDDTDESDDTADA